MGTRSRGPLVSGMLLILLGAGWLLNTLNVLPGVNWVWTMGLGVVGVLFLALGGLNKFTIVIGPLLILASAASVLRQTGRLHVDHEIPGLVMALGVLIIVAHLAPLPAPDWLREPPPRK